MKHHYVFCFILLCLSTMVHAQFGPPQLINALTDSPSSKQFIRTADVDSDGQPDILVASSGNQQIRYFKNNGGLNFDASTLLPGSWIDLQAMETADLNTDGTPDIATLDILAHKLYWHPNTNGSFSEQLLIADNLMTVSSRILCKDFNGDGTIDIVILNHINALIFFNDGAGHFSAPETLLAPEDEGEIYDHVVGYFNDDAFLDLAISSVGFIVYLNDGTGHFTKTPAVSSTISFLLESADYSNDGLDDMLIKGLALVPYLNTGTGFSQVGTFAPNTENYQTLFSSDLDGDGDLDVLSEDNQTNAFFWYENVGNGTAWVRHTLSITNNFSSIYGVSAADLDVDGDNDLIRTSGTNEVEVYENLSTLALNDPPMDSLLLVPNPANSQMTIYGAPMGVFEVTIYDALGKHVFTREAVGTLQPIDISSLSTGHYLVKLFGTLGTVVKQLVVWR